MGPTLGPTSKKKCPTIIGVFSITGPTNSAEDSAPTLPAVEAEKRLSSAPSRSPLRSQPRARPEPTQSPPASSLRDPRKTTSRDPTAQLSSPTRENPTELRVRWKIPCPPDILTSKGARPREAISLPRRSV